MTNLDQRYDVDHRIVALENHQRGLLVSLAGPGTGKTFSFLRRITSLTSSQRVAPNAICYLSFINEITKAFLTDYEQEFGRSADDPQRPRISTLHSFACRLIRNRGFSVGFDGPIYFTSIADPEAIPSLVFLTDLLPMVTRTGLTSVPQLRCALYRVKEAWRDNVDPESLQGSEPSMLETCFALAHAYRLIDWDQAVPIAHSLFLEPQNREEWLVQLQHYLVDEYQDFNKAEQAFILALQSTVTSMVIAGDDNQSIYGGRGGSPSGMRQLYQSPDCDQVSLQRCRRCKSAILDAANTFLHSMRSTALPMLPSDVGGKVECHSFRSCKAEIAFLMDYLRRRLGEMPEQPLPRHGIVCLFPTKKALGFYFDRIRTQFPCYTTKMEPYPLREKLSCLLELMCNPSQRFIQRVVLERFFKIKPAYKREMVQIISANDKSPVEALESLISNGRISGQAAEHTREFIKLCEAFSSLDSGVVARAISQFITADCAQLQTQIENLFARLSDSDQEDAINDFCDCVIPDSVQPPEDPNAILFLTMHGSKGLTKKTVVMPGLEKAWLPGQALGDDLAERKRLFYVALTRATDHVLITYPRTRARGDPLNYNAEGRGEVCHFVNDSHIPVVNHY